MDASVPKVAVLPVELVSNVSRMACSEARVAAGKRTRRV